MTRRAAVTGGAKLRTVVAGLAVLSCLATTVPAEQTSSRPHELAFFHPWIEVAARDEVRLERGEVVVRGLSGDHHEIGVFAACRIDITPDRFLARVRRIERLRRNGPVREIRRFSDPPALADLSDLTLDDGDIERLRRCRPGDCRLHLSDAEIAAVRKALEGAGEGSSERAQQAFRRIVLERVRLYTSGGLQAVPDYHDHREPVRLADVFSGIMGRSAYLSERVPQFAAHLERFPHAPAAGVESFLYWSKELITDKTVISVTHVSILTSEPGTGLPAVLVAGKQVFASRYMDGALGLTMLFTDIDGPPGYLVYVNRSSLDVLGGLFGGLKRAIIKGRIEREAARVLEALRRRLETPGSG